MNAVPATAASQASAGRCAKQPLRSYQLRTPGSTHRQQSLRIRSPGVAVGSRLGADTRARSLNGHNGDQRSLGKQHLERRHDSSIRSLHSIRLIGSSEPLSAPMMAGGLGEPMVRTRRPRTIAGQRLTSNNDEGRHRCERRLLVIDTWLSTTIFWSPLTRWRFSTSCNNDCC